MDASSTLKEFLRETEVDPSENHRARLLQAYDLVNSELVAFNFPIKTVRLAHKIYGYLGNKGIHKRVELMNRFLQTGNGNLDDKFWAKWELVDNLALLNLYSDMIKEQQEFLRWCKAHMVQDYWLRVMYDSTQAIGWFERGMIDEWFDIYHALISKVVPTSANRRDRALYVETAAGLLVHNLHRYDQAISEIERYRSIVSEDALWDEFDEFNSRIKTYELGVYGGQQQWDKYDQVVEEAIQIIKDRMAKHERGTPVEINGICDMAHEIGACLMWEKRYERAIPLFEYAIAKQGTGVTHFYYTVCVWATEKNQAKTIYHLRMADTTTKGNQGLRSRYKKMFLDVEEFADVHDDKKFLSIFSE